MVATNIGESDVDMGPIGATNEAQTERSCEAGSMDLFTPEDVEGLVQRFVHTEPGEDRWAQGSFHVRLLRTPERVEMEMSFGGAYPYLLQLDRLSRSVTTMAGQGFINDRNTQWTACAPERLEQHLMHLFEVAEEDQKRLQAKNQPGMKKPARRALWEQLTTLFSLDATLLERVWLGDTEPLRNEGKNAWETFLPALLASEAAMSVDWNATTDDVIFVAKRLLGPRAVEVDFSSLRRDAKEPNKTLGALAKLLAPLGFSLVEVDSGGDSFVFTLVTDGDVAKSLAKVLRGLGHRAKIR